MNVYQRQAGFGLEASISVGKVGLLSLSCVLGKRTRAVRMLADSSEMSRRVVVETGLEPC